MTHHATFRIASTHTAARVPIIDEILSTVRRHLDMPLAYLAVFDSGDVVYRAVSTDRRAPYFEAGDRRPAKGSYCLAVRDGRLPQMLADTRTNPVAMSLPATVMLPVGAFVAVPLLMADGSAYGVFCCMSHDPMPNLSERDLAIVTNFAQLLADAIGSGVKADQDGRDMRQQIEDVIVDRDFTLLLQPIVALHSNAVVGAEALCRFRPTPYRNPDTWFADARKIGMQRELERAVILKTLDRLEDLPRALTLSINVSPDMMIHGNLPAMIDGPNSDRIVLELTEHNYFDSMTDLQTQIKHLRRMGAKIAVDDLSAAHSSLSTVLQIKPDFVKLDSELVRGIHMDPASQALTAGIVHFAKAINADVIAEGVERVQEAESLHKLGVKFGQGYFLGRPGGMNALQARMYQI